MARRADEVARIVQERVAFGIPPVILALRVDVGERRLNRGQLVLPDAPIQNLLDTEAGIKAPAIAFVDEREGERPVVADDQREYLGRLAYPTVSGVERGDELVALVDILDRVAGLHDRSRVFAQYMQYGARLAGPHRGEQSLTGLIRRVVSSLVAAEEVAAAEQRERRGRDNTAAQLPADHRRPPPPRPPPEKPPPREKPPALRLE